MFCRELAGEATPLSAKSPADARWDLGGDIPQLAKEDRRRCYKFGDVVRHAATFSPEFLGSVLQGFI